MTPAWVSQYVGDLGATMSEGLRNQLGRPSMDPLTVLLREAAQNSWDARLERDGGSITFNLALQTLQGAHRAAWAEALLPGRPPSESLPLDLTFSRDSLLVLFVSDRGTRGLGGPVRGGIRVAKGEPKDYSSFVLNSGEPRDIASGGGTYGFGKGIFFSVSRCHTAVVYTRCASASGLPESRLIACSVGASYEADERLLTGRHWWGGVEAGEQAVDPITGPAADAIAASLGFPGFDGNDLGTTIAVLDPDLGERSPLEAGEHLAEAAAWNLWPKLLPRSGGPRDADVGVSVDAVKIDIPDPSTDKLLRAFVASYRAIREGRGEAIRHVSLDAALGHLAFHRGYGVAIQPPLAARELGVGDRLHHVCLIRAPAELVVSYLPGDGGPDEHVWYGGVFVTDVTAESTFAYAEPPTHDAWVPEQLRGDDRKKVVHALRQIRAGTRGLLSPSEPSVTQNKRHPLGAASASLAGLLAPASGDGASLSRPSGGGGGNARRRPVNVRLSPQPSWETSGQETLLVQRFDVSAQVEAELQPIVGVAVWGAGRETEAPQGSAEPSFVAWRAPDGSLRKDPVLVLPAGEHANWAAIVRPVRDVAATVDIRASGVKP